MPFAQDFMKIFKISNPKKSPAVEFIIKHDKLGNEIAEMKILVEKESSILVDENRGGRLLRRFDFLKNEVFEKPVLEIFNPSSKKVSAILSGIEKKIKPKKSIVIDRFLGAEFLSKYYFLVGKEYKPKVRKRKATKKAVKKVAKKRKSKVVKKKK